MKPPPPLKTGKPLRTASNVLALLLLAAGGILAADWVNLQLGNPPFVSCAVMPVLHMMAPPLGIAVLALAAIGLLTGRWGAGFVFALVGLLLWQLPDLLGLVLQPRC